MSGFFIIVDNEAQYQKYNNTTSGLTATNTQAAIDEVVQDLADGLAAQNEASEITYDNTSSGLTATDVQAAIDEVYTAHDEASEISYDGATSGLAATDTQAAIDEVVAEKLDIPGFVLWERRFWSTLINGVVAPTPADGGPGWFYFDTVAEELYGPAVFNPALLPAGVWDWGTALSNVVFSATAPTDEAGDWYVWDDSGTYVLFQKKTAINTNDMLFYDGTNWQARSQKFSADDVYADLSNIDTVYGVDAIQTQLNNLYSNYAQAYNGGNSFYMENNIDTTYEVNPFDGNVHILTLVNDTTISFSSAWDPTSQLGTRAAELTIVLIQDSTGGWITTWDSNVKVSSGTTLTTTADAVDMLKAVSWDGGTTWYVTQIGADFA